MDPETKDDCLKESFEEEEMQLRNIWTITNNQRQYAEIFDNTFTFISSNKQNKQTTLIYVAQTSLSSSLCIWLNRNSIFFWLGT